MVWVGLTAQAGAAGAADLTRTARSLDAAEVELTQLPPAADWRSLASTVSAGLAGLLYQAPAGADWRLYGRDRNGPAWLLASRDPDGTLVVSDSREVVQLTPGRAAAEPNPQVRLWIFRTGAVLEYGGRLLFEAVDVSGWRWYWICPGGAPPAPQKLYPADLEDGFMRTAFGGSDRWTCRSGRWQLKQYGGGMPTTSEQARNPDFRRAANAFTLVGQNGEACHGRELWTNLYAEARFFFGRPDSYAKRDTLVGTSLGGEPQYADPTAIYRSDQVHEYPETDFFVVHGAAGGFRLAFGWSADRRRMQLRRQDPGQTDWQVLKEWNTRPYLSNWVRIGLGVSRGCRALPFLDGEQLGAYPQDCVVRGPVALLAGPQGKAEVDDVVAWSYPEPTRLGAPVFETSAHFAQKDLLPTKDKQTGQWTRSEMTFEDDDARVRGRALVLKRCQFPCYGDFTYYASPDLPGGDYLLALVDAQERPYYSGFFTKLAAGWSVPLGKPELSLELGRRKGRVVRRVNGEWELVCTRQVPATVWLVLGAADEGALDPANHVIYSRCLTHDLFERAASEWAWREGNFRMDVRWQCQRGWNFMMGKSRDVAVMYSKTAYEGDQEIEFYVALRFCTPPPYYVVRDMGFSFCSDGRSLASGYTLIYGDRDNTRTVLLRDGVPVQEAPVVIKPKGTDTNIHNYWWHGRVTRHAKTVKVEIDDQTVLTFSDPRPLSGGHVAFWTVRNAISLAKVSVNAERAEPHPERFRLPADPPPEGPWQALNPDETEVRRTSSGRWEAVNRVGGGTFAVRHQPPPPGVDLRETPWLHIPLKCERDTRVGVHLQIGGKPFYYPVGSPRESTHGLLVPCLETAEPEEIYRGAAYTAEEMRDLLVPGRQSAGEVVLDLRGVAKSAREPFVQSLTVGNSSNEGYLLLGVGGNPPGSSYVVGAPQWRK